MKETQTWHRFMSKPIGTGSGWTPALGHPYANAMEQGHQSLGAGRRAKIPRYDQVCAGDPGRKQAHIFPHP